MPLGVRRLLKFLYKHLSAGFEVPTAPTVNSMTFLVVVPCTQEKVPTFQRKHRLRLVYRKVNEAQEFSWRRREARAVKRTSYNLRP
jgi:hypothetical protein